MYFDWAHKPLSQFLDHRSEAWSVLHVVSASLRTATWSNVYGEITGQLPHPAPDDTMRLLETPDAVMGLLYAQDLVAAWSTLETLVRDTARSWLLHIDATWELPALQSVKGELMPFARLSREEQASAIADLVQRDQKVLRGKTWGIERLEALLAAFGLDTAPLKPELRTALLALGHIRNVWAHSSGIADSAFVAAAPHLGWKEGERVLLDREQYETYARAITEYGYLLSSRTLERLQALGLIRYRPDDPTATRLDLTDQPSPETPLQDQ